MSFIIFVVYRFFTLIFEIVSIAMLIRAILSWFPIVDPTSKFMQLIYTVTEFFIAPIRALMWRIPFVRSFPLDLSFLVTYILLGAAQSLLYYAYSAVV